MYWNGGQVIGGDTGDGFYDPDGSLGQDYLWKTEAERARLASLRYPQQVPVGGLGQNCIEAGWKQQVLACYYGTQTLGCDWVTQDHVNTAQSTPVCGTSGGGGGGGTSTGGIYAGVYSPSVLAVQQALNSLANALNYETLGEDGKLGPATCGALAYFSGQIDPAELNLVYETAVAVAGVLQQNLNVGSACSAQVGQPWKTPARVGPLPTPAPPEPQYTPEEVAYLCALKAQQDGLLSACELPECYAGNKANCDTAMTVQPAAEPQYTPEQIGYLCQLKAQQDGPRAACEVPECYATNSDCAAILAAPAAAPAPQYTTEQLNYLCLLKIQQDGTLAMCDVPECYGLNPSGCDSARAVAPGCMQLISEQGVAGACAVPECFNLNPTGCNAAATQEPTYTFEEPEVLSTTGACQFNYGDSHPQIGLLQEQLNVALNMAGYNPIAVTGTYDAPTCGAIFELGGTFSPSPSQLCPQNWVIPLSCAQSTPPTKRGIEPIEPSGPPKKKKISTAAMLGIGGALLAAVVGGGIYAAKAKAGGM